MTSTKKQKFGKLKIITAALIAGVLLVIFLVLNLSLGDKKIDQQVKPLYATDDAQFPRSMNSMLGPALLSGNHIDTLLNGDQIFPAMLKALGEARKTINFETYIYWQGEIGEQFARVLSERAKAGVRVHVMLDWVGSGKIDSHYLQQMEEAGVLLRRYNKPAWYSFGRMNNRTHRKLLVVDGKVGFTGGVGIADNWNGNAQDPDHWRDTHFRIEGPAVAQMQTAFLENWSEVTGEVLHGEDYYPALQPAGAQHAQVFSSSPGSGSENMHMMYLLSIAAARKTIHLSASYFVPDEVAVSGLVAALKRGVKVQIILPGPIIDAKLVRRASCAQWGPLLENGAEIYEYQPTMFHTKVMVVDGVWSSVGSTNFDNRSFSINDESNLNVYDRDFARSQIGNFDDDLQRSRRISLEEWRNRPWTAKLWEHTVGLFAAQL